MSGAGPSTLRLIGAVGHLADTLSRETDLAQLAASRARALRRRACS